jgi:putative transcriptional regulator
MHVSVEKIDFLISQYVAGSLPRAAHVLLGSHLQMRKPNARLVDALQRLAGDGLDDMSCEGTLSREFRDRAISEIVRSDPPEWSALPQQEGDQLPALLRGYTGIDLTSIPWRQKLPGLREHVIERSPDLEASLLWARPGRALPNHGHHGLELTLVIEGEFRDHRGNFTHGDISVADETLDHRPVAGSSGPCVCFSVLFAPIALSGSPIQLMSDIIGL